MQKHPPRDRIFGRQCRDPTITSRENTLRCPPWCGSGGWENLDNEKLQGFLSLSCRKRCSIRLYVKHDPHRVHVWVRFMDVIYLNTLPTNLEASESLS